MTDKLNNRVKRGFFGRRVTNWCSPPLGPPKDKLDNKEEVLPITVNGKACMEGISTPWFTGPPKITGEINCCEGTIKKFPKKHFIEDELDTFEIWLKEAEPWSSEKTHLMTLVAEIARTEKIPLKYRTRASGLIRSNVDDPIMSAAVK